MARLRTVAWTLGGAVLGLASLLVIGILVLTRTDWARDHVRRLVLDQLEERVAGEVTIERLDGDLLTGATLEGVRIADSTGARVLAADTVSFGYALPSLFSRRFVFHRVRLVRPVVVLDRRAGGNWNVLRLLRAPAGGGARSGSPEDSSSSRMSLMLARVEIVDGTVVVRQPWRPETRSARDSVDPGRERPRLVRVAEGYQSVWEFRSIDGKLPIVDLADPGRRVRIGSLDMEALLYRGPAVLVHDLSGTFELDGDSVRFEDVRVRLPETRLSADGTIALHDPAEARGRTRIEAFSLGDLHWLRPGLPRGGGRIEEVQFDLSDGRGRVEARGIAVDVDGARIKGVLDVGWGEEFRLGPTDLEFAGMTPELLEDLAPGLTLPGRGVVLGGRVRLVGPPSATHMDGTITARARDGSISTLLAVGRIDTADGEVSADGLRISFRPLRAGLIRTFHPELPVDGSVTGEVTLDGPPRDLSATLDLTHDGATGTSRLVGIAAYDTRSERAVVDVEAHTLSLETLGRAVPAAGLRGTARGGLQARGTMEELLVGADLEVGEDGRVTVSGTLDLTAERPGYELEGRLELFDAASVSSRLPGTRLTGTFAARGRGVEPASAEGTLRADLTDTSVEDVAADSSHVVIGVANGVATVERAQIRMASAMADLTGTFGLVGSEAGELRYTVRIDSLGDFRERLPARSGDISPRPAVQAKALARRGEDPVSVTDELVERMADGRPAPPGAVPDTVAAVPGDSVAGVLEAEGTVTGNVASFDIQGSARGRRLVLAGSRIEEAEASYTLADVGGPSADFQAAMSARSLTAFGFAFDSVGVDVDHRGAWRQGSGTAELEIFQDPDRDYRAVAEFQLDLDRSEARLTEMTMRFDTTRWRSTAPGTVGWGGDGVVVDELELVNGGGSRILLAGRLPRGDDIDMHVEMEEVEIAQLVGLVQDTITARGRLTLDATVGGTRRAPRLEGTGTLQGGELRSHPLPRIETRFGYAHEVLALNAVLTSDTIGTLTADLSLPLDLALEREPGPRLLDRELHASVKADSLSLAALPGLAPVVDDVQGSVRADLDVAGTLEAPEFEGAIVLDVASVRVVPAGITLREVGGSLRFEGHRARIDSIVARSSDGEIRVAGEVNLTTLTRPELDLAVTTNEAIVLDNDRGRVRASLDVSVEGPVTAPLLSGDVHVLRGVVYAPEGAKRRVTDVDDPTVVLGLAREDTAPDFLPRPTFLDSLRLDLGVTVDRDTWVRNSDGNVEISTPSEAEPVRIRMDAGLETLSLVGTIRADRGEYSYAGSRFELTAGSATFLPGQGIDPLLQLSAQKRIDQRGREALIIQIHVLGTLTEPRVALESNAQPPLPESDLIAYLAFGESSSSLLDLNQSGVTSGTGLRAAGLLLQQQLAGVSVGAALDEAVSDIERQGTRNGLDVFRIHPASLPSELAFDRYLDNFLHGTELEVGKYLGNVFVAGQARLGNPLPGIRVEYGFSTTLTWETTWESRYLPREPTLSADIEGTRSRVLGTFLVWKNRF